jgi:hypothetical protein
MRLIGSGVAKWAYVFGGWVWFLPRVPGAIAGDGMSRCACLVRRVAVAAYIFSQQPKRASRLCFRLVHLCLSSRGITFSFFVPDRRRCGYRHRCRMVAVVSGYARDRSSRLIASVASGRRPLSGSRGTGSLALRGSVSRIASLCFRARSGLLEGWSAVVTRRRRGGGRTCRFALSHLPLCCAAMLDIL